MTTVTACTSCGEPAAPEVGPRCLRCDDDLSHLYALVYDDLRFCGCGCPDEAYNLVRDLLALAPFYDHQDELKARIGVTGDDHGALYLVLYALDKAGLTEHGGSVAGSWLTPKGTHYLGLMRAYEHGELDHVGYPHDGGKCPRDCRHRKASEQA